MGWLFEYNTGWMSRKEYARKLVAEQNRTWSQGSCHVLDHSLRGNDLWMVLEVYRKDTGQINRFIVLARLSREDRMWGYKDMDEDCGPYFFTCPLKFLKMTKPRTECSLNWRKGVRTYHDKVNRRRKLIKLWRTDREAYYREVKISS